MCEYVLHIFVYYAYITIKCMVQYIILILC